MMYRYSNDGFVNLVMIDKKILSLVMSVILIVLLGVVFKYHSLIQSHGPNHQYAYLAGENFYVYDLATDKISTIDYKGGVEDLAWSKDGKLAFKDANGGLYLVDIVSAKVTLLQGGPRGSFYWNKEGTFLVNYNFYSSDGTPEVKQKFYLVGLDKTVKEISREESDDIFYEGFNKVIDKASFDSRFISRSVYSDSEENQVYLIDQNTGKEFKLPDGVFGPEVSPQYTYLAYKDNLSFSDGPDQVYKLRDVIEERFDKPVFSISMYDHQWLDDTHLLYLTEQVLNDDEYLKSSYIYYILDVPTGKSKKVYQKMNTPQLYADLYIVPGGKKMALTWRNGNTLSDTADLVLVDLQTGQETKRITNYQPYPANWSYPIY